MSRLSNDQLDAYGNVFNGFDYDLQVWVKEGIIQRCGHRESMKCDCLGLRFEGRSVEYAKNVLSEVA